MPARPAFPSRNKGDKGDDLSTLKAHQGDPANAAQLVMAGVPHITAGMLDALTGTLEGGAPLISRTIGSWVAESEVADLLRDAERRHEGVAIGSYPFFRDGRVGANFVVRSTEADTVAACVNDVAERLKAAGFDVIEGGI